MSPPPRVILLDSCAYFRLARSIHPLLAGTFGPAPPYSLFVLAALDDEYLTGSRLKNKFEWVNGTEYRQDRRVKQFSCRGKSAAPADSAFSYLAAYAKNQRLILAPEDLKVLAVGFTRGFPVVSDDGCIRQVAAAHSITCWGSLDLLKLMVDCDRIDVPKVKEILQYWDHENDLPMGKDELRERYKELFGSGCPV
jgi:hypothetical protein